MKCPICGNEMKILTKYGIDVDFCSECKSVWFDSGEMQQLSDSLNKITIEEPTICKVDITKTPEKDFHCPRCNCRMFKVKMNNKGPIFDYCPEGCGYLFEDKEFEEYVKNNYTKQIQ